MAVLPSTREPPGSVRRNSAYGAEARTSSAPSSRRVQSADPLAPHGYQTLGPIAAGAFSQIARARHAGSRCEVAVKSFNKVKCAKEPHLGSAMKNELDVLKLLQPAKHRHVANILAVLESKNSIHAVLEYCGGGSLHRQLQTRGHAKGFSERESIVVTAQLCSGLAYMHGLGVAHRDVKPENILFTDGSLSSVKLCDFGFAIRCGERRLRTVCGSPQYMAPELSRHEPYHGQPVDVWALCAVVYEMLHGKAAFRGSSMEQLGIRIMRVSHESFGTEASAGARSFIKQGLTFDPQARALAQDLSNHSWLGALRQEAQEEARQEEARQEALQEARQQALQQARQESIECS